MSIGFSFDTSSLLNGRRDLLPPEVFTTLWTNVEAVIAAGEARAVAVVTEETPSGNLDKPRIPDVCEAMGVGWLNLIGFVRQRGWSF